MITQLVAALNAYDLESAVALFEPSASFVMKPGLVVNGTVGIRRALEGFMALKPAITIEAQQVVQASDVVQYCARWNLEGIDFMRTAVQLGGRSSSILRRRKMGDGCSLWITPGGQISSCNGAAGGGGAGDC
ncbi:MAG: nuclear transport factor 2 family protein [Nitrospira sp.]|nr:nuclear transport factor 2 family protein [Nitrospira sp.]